MYSYSEELMRHRREIGSDHSLLPALLADAIVAVQDCETRIDELVEAKDNAWRCVSKLGIELENKYRIRVAKLMLQDEYTRSQVTKSLRLDDSHGPMSASLEFIVQTIDSLIRQVTVSPNAKFASEPMVKDRITELVESEEKAWQTVAKLRVELETTDRLRIQVAELTTERDRAVEDLRRLTDAFECSEHPDAIHMVKCTACGKERHVPA